MNGSVHNPYYNVASIDNPDLFFGRSNDIEVLLNALFSGPPQCYSIVGQRKIGKTSLVQHLSLSSTIREFGFSPDNCLFVYLDCQKKTDALKSVDNFYAELLNQLTLTIPNDLADVALASPAGPNDAPMGARWEQVVKELGKRDYRVVPVFDEFEKAIIQEPLVKEGLFGSLRALAQHNSNLAWLTCTSRLLHDLFEEAFDEYGISPAKRKSESDFYNIAPVHSLRLFAEESDTLELITSPSGCQGVAFSPKDIETIIGFGGNFPYFVQRACYHFFGAYIGGTVQREVIRRLCVRESIQLWEAFWNKLTDRQQALLFAIANGRVVDADAYELESLKDTALIYEDDDGDLHPFSQEFGAFVRSKSEEIQLKAEDKLIGIVDDLPPPEPEILLSDDYSKSVWDTIIELERELRRLIVDRCRTRWGTKWEDQLAERYPKLYANWTDRRNKDGRTFKLYDRELQPIFEFSYLAELGILMESDWDYFQEIFEFAPGQGKSNKRTLHQKIEEIARVRNPLAHGRAVPETELRRVHVACDDLKLQIGRWKKESGRARQLTKSSRKRDISSRPDTGFDLEIERRLRDLDALLADKYVSAWAILKTDIPNYSGAVSEIRETLSLLLRSLAPNEEVISDPDYKVHRDSKGRPLDSPTRRQRVKFLLRKYALAGDAKAIEKEIELFDTLVERLGKVVVDAYGDASARTHTSADYNQARKCLKQLDSILEQLLP